VSLAQSLGTGATPASSRRARTSRPDDPGLVKVTVPEARRLLRLATTRRPASSTAPAKPPSNRHPQHAPGNTKLVDLRRPWAAIDLLVTMLHALGGARWEPRRPDRSVVCFSVLKQPARGPIFLVSSILN
jgi:hypothetical protein